jgi:hypothetical protein
MKGRLTLYPSIVMTAAAPKGTPPQQISDFNPKKIPCLPCPEEALKWSSFVEMTILIVSAVHIRLKSRFFLICQ